MHILREIFSIWIAFTGINKDAKGAAVQISTAFLCFLWKGPLKRDFLVIYLTTFFGSGKFKNTSAMRVITFWKCSKFNLNLENGKKSLENISGFWDNCIWKCCNKLPLLRKEYLLSALSQLRTSPNILHITQRDFSNLNCLHKDQQIW